VLQPEVTKIQ